MHADLQRFREQASSMHAEGSDIEAILTLARQKGCSQIDSIKLVKELFGLSLAEAKERVHFSRTWQDVRDANEAFHEALVEMMTEETEQTVRNRVTAEP